jgi:glycosyltransferase involved in cell wall biosynthesis
MKILHIYREKNKGQIGGVEYHIKYLAQQQQKLGLTPSVMTYSLSNRDHLTVENRNGIDWYLLEIKDPIYKIAQQLKGLESGGLGFTITPFDRIRQNLRISKKLNLIKDIHPDIIHQHDYLSSIRLSKKVSKKFMIIFTNHYGEYLFLKKTKITRYLQQHFLAHFNAIIAPSQNLLPSQNNSYFIPNGFDTNGFLEIGSNEKLRLKTEQGLERKVVFLCARRWAPTKGVLYLAKALNLLSDDVKQKSVFLFAGNDAEDFPIYRKQVQAELDQSIGVDFRLCGNVDHDGLIPLINISDIGVIPSLMEGMSLFSIELISCGIPVLATDVGGLPEIIKPNENGWLVPQKNAQKIAEEITRIVSNWPDTNLPIKTLEFRKKYSWESIAQQTLEIYKTVNKHESISRHWNETRSN